jgi:predicted nucleic acid-binding protein
MKSDDASFFVDANVLVYAALKDDSRHEVSKALLKDAGRGALHISSQILAEFYSTVTSPKRVTSPYSPSEAVDFIETL